MDRDELITAFQDTVDFPKSKELNKAVRRAVRSTRIYPEGFQAKQVDNSPILSSEPCPLFSAGTTSRI